MSILFPAVSLGLIVGSLNEWMTVQALLQALFKVGGGQREAFRKVTSEESWRIRMLQRGEKRTFYQAEGTACAKVSRQGAARCFNLAAFC